MSYSFLLTSGRLNTVVVPVGTGSNGQTAVLNRKNSTLNSTGSVSNGKATFDISADRVLEFAGSYAVTVGGAVVQTGDVDVIIVNSGGGGSADLTNYYNKTQTNSLVVSAVSAKADLNYVNSALATKANTNDLDAKLDASLVKTVATSGNYSDLTGKPDLSGFATAANVTSGLNAKANIADVYDKTQVDTKLSSYSTTTATTTALAVKANASDVYTKSQVDTAVSAKADASNVYTKSAADAKFALIGSSGGGPSNVLVLGPSDPVPSNTATGTVILRKAS